MTLLERILKQNPWWQNKEIEEIKDYKERFLLKEILKYKSGSLSEGNFFEGGGKSEITSMAKRVRNRQRKVGVVFSNFDKRERIMFF